MARSRPKIGLLMLIALVSGNMIGSGAFLLPSSLANIGSISLLSWCVTALGAIFLALIFAKFSAAYPKTGGPYAYVKATMGNFLGFQTAYCYWIAAWVGNAAIVVAMMAYASVFFPSLSDPKHACIAAIIVLWILTLMNTFNIKFIGGVQLLSTILKIVPLLLVGVLGWFYVNPDNFSQFINVTTPQVSDVSAVNLGAALTFWAFIGLESATLPADMIDNPKRIIPMATIIGTLLAAAVYISSSAAIFGIVPVPELQGSDAPFSLAAGMMFGRVGVLIVSIGAIVSCFGCLNGWILLQGQIAMAAADDELFPKVFAKRNKSGLPVKGLVITSLLITLLLLMTVSKTLSQQFETIILIAVFATLVPYFYTVLSYLLKYVNLHQKYLVRYLVVSLSAAIYVCWAIWGSGEKIIAYGSWLLISSAVVYVFIIPKHKGENYVD